VSRVYSNGAGATAVPALRIDSDRDGDIDQSDFAHMQGCLTGVNVPLIDPACSKVNLDGPADTDVDAQDMTFFLGCYSGPNLYADPAGCPY
jgi:hypothetical protein